MQDAPTTTPDAAVSDETTSPFASRAGSPSARVRRAQADDAWAISALLDACSPRCVAQPVETVLATLGEWLVAPDGAGGIRGCVRLAARGGAIEVRSVAVDDAARGLGVGAALLGRAAAMQAALGLDLVCITCEPRFFRRFGFEIERAAPAARRGLNESLNRARVRMRRPARAPGA